MANIRIFGRLPKSRGVFCTGGRPVCGSAGGGADFAAHTFIYYICTESPGRGGASAWAMELRACSPFSAHHLPAVHDVDALGQATEAGVRLHAAAIEGVDAGGRRHRGKLRGLIFSNREVVPEGRQMLSAGRGVASGGRGGLSAEKSVPLQELDNNRKS